MKRIAVGIEYNGCAYSGWQVQPAAATVQGCIEFALEKMAGHPIRLHAAGRTDAGVHASMQVAHFDTDASRPITAWVRGVNSFLPKDISILWAKEVSDEFHSRFSAMARHYRYILLNHPIRSALMAGRVGWLHQEVSLEKMHRAATLLLGEHDFSSFRAAECQAKTPVKQLYKLEITQSGSLILCDFSANAFLHHMVRNIMGSLLHVGKGNQKPEWILDLLAQKNRAIAPPTFMPDGLYLTGVSYPEKFDLSTQSLLRHDFI